ncbi:hypothetical protein F1D05_12735 [Kribbella qitaiheensis]|uniref:Uncharacterized protein n=1 Tax=Kribbella qitaiheensis TaxID=1544730 RepID=A0A7G6WXA0_9ACTN|nr:hypothetical protein [Kribbella qitaiheensis]QNE18615.1 hypothetical protein F1D05_12735 [Kribbella qitaiheensis]
MTVPATSLPDSGDQTGRNQSCPPPHYTRREAVRAGLCTKKVYTLALTYYDYVVRNHLASDTPRERWEPQDVVGCQLSADFVQDGRELLAERLEEDVDPALDDIEGLCIGVSTAIDTIEKRPGDLSTPETNKVYGGRSAVSRVSELTDRVETERAMGHRHHDRAPRWLRVISVWAPWAEAMGFLAFLTYYLNVPILSPWQDWMGWTFSLILVVYIILGQTWLVDHAARAHNHCREAQADGQKHSAETSRRQRLGYLLVTGGIAGGITAALIERGLDALGNAQPAITAVMIVLALTTGLLMPTLTFLGKALDGSKVSRERDALSRDLDADLDWHDELVDQVELDLAAARNIDHELVEKVVPAIRSEVQDLVNEAHVPYDFLRLQIGGLSGSHTVPSTAVATTDPAGSISNGIPGADAISLQPVVDRNARLAALRGRIADLDKRFRALSAHPWDHSRSERTLDR